MVSYLDFFLPPRSSWAHFRRICSTLLLNQDWWSCKSNLSTHKYILEISGMLFLTECGSLAMMFKDPRDVVSLSNWWCIAWHEKSSALTAVAPVWLGCLAGTGASPSVMADAMLEDFISASLAAASPPRVQTGGASIQDFDQEPNPEGTSSFGSCNCWRCLRRDSSQYSWHATPWICDKCSFDKFYQTDMPAKAVNEEGTWIYVPRDTSWRDFSVVEPASDFRSFTQG